MNRPTPRFKAALFDMDGLLLDSERLVRDAWLEVASNFSIPLEESTYLGWVGRREKDVRADYEQLFAKHQPFDKITAQVRARVDARQATEGFKVKPGAESLLGRLHEQGIPCAVASSTRQPEVHRRLSSVGLDSYFRSLTGGDEVSRGKPDPDLFLLAAQRIRVPPTDCVVFEDSEYGAMAAIAAGMAVVVVPDLKQPSREIAALSLAILTSLEQVEACFETWFVG